MPDCSPNCTLVELKFDQILGIFATPISPNCTLVELKCDTGRKRHLLVAAPNCTLVELKFLNNMMNAENVQNSKLYLSGIEMLNQPPCY